MSPRNDPQADSIAPRTRLAAGRGPARNEPTDRFGSLRRGAGESEGEVGAARNEATSAGVAAQNEPTSAPGPTRAERTQRAGAGRTEGAPAPGPRAPAPRRSERTERGLGKAGAAVWARRRDSERTERRAGGCGQALPRDRGGAERTEGAASGAENEPKTGTCAEKTNPISGPAPSKQTHFGGPGAKTNPNLEILGHLEGKWGLDRGGWVLAGRGAERTHFGPRPRRAERTHRPLSFTIAGPRGRQRFGPCPLRSEAGTITMNSYGDGRTGGGPR
jgi:hypothetical protein